MQFSIKDFFSKCDQIRSFLRIWSHLLKISLIENCILCAVLDVAIRKKINKIHNFYCLDIKIFIIAGIVNQQFKSVRQMPGLFWISEKNDSSLGGSKL